MLLQRRGDPVRLLELELALDAVRARSTRGGAIQLGDFPAGHAVGFELGHDHWHVGFEVVFELEVGVGGVEDGGNGGGFGGIGGRG